MSGKKQLLANAWAEPTSLQSIDTQLYGASNAPDSGRQIAKPINIFEIYPDPTQPRRAVPSAARFDWDGQPNSVAEMIASWAHLVAQERESSFDLSAYFDPSSEIERHESPGPLETSINELIDLALSIRTEGKLINPITITRHGESYRIETGERRWLAYHLLYALDHDDRWLKILANVVDRVDPWRQAIENSARLNLNAISRARQLSLLIMDIYAAQGYIFSPFAEMVQPGAPDQPFYAQVADGDEYRIPAGKSSALLAALGLRNSSQLRQYRALLRIPADLWTRADDESWPENQIRNYFQNQLSTVTGRNGQPSKTIKSADPKPEPLAKGSVLICLNKLRTLSESDIPDGEQNRAILLRQLTETEQFIANLKSRLNIR